MPPANEGNAGRFVRKRALSSPGALAAGDWESAKSLTSIGLRRVARAGTPVARLAVEPRWHTSSARGHLRRPALSSLSPPRRSREHRVQRCPLRDGGTRLGRRPRTTRRSPRHLPISKHRFVSRESLTPYNGVVTRTHGRHRLILITSILLAACAIAGLSAAYAQIIMGGFRTGRVNWARVDDFDGSFNYCRGFYQSAYGEAGGRVVHRLSGRRQQLLGQAVGADAGPGEARRISVPAPRRRAAQRSAPLPMPDALHGGRRADPSREGSGEACEAPAQGMDFCGLTTSGAAPPGGNGSASSRACCRRGVPIFDLRFAPDHAHGVRRRRIPAGAGDQLLRTERRRLGARLRQRGGSLPGRSGLARPADGADDAQHGRRRHLGARRGKPREFFKWFSPRGYAVGVNVVLYAMTH